jgi:hypothetical protein
MDLKKEITEMIYKNSNDTSEGVLIDFKVIPPLIENIVAITVTRCCKSDSELFFCCKQAIDQRCSEQCLGCYTYKRD